MVEFYQQLDQIFSDTMSQLENASQEVNKNVNILSEFLLGKSEEGKDIVEVVRNEGFDAILKNQISTIDMSIQTILDCARDNIKIGL